MSAKSLFTLLIVVTALRRLMSAGVTQLKSRNKENSENEKSSRNQSAFTKNQDGLSFINAF